MIQNHYLQVLKKNKNYSSLCDFYNDRVEEAPNEVSNYQKLANFQEKNKDDKSAWKTYSLIEKKFSRADISLPRKADMLLRQGDEKKAIKLLEKLVELYPINPSFLKKSSIVYRRLNLPEKARNCYYKILQIDSLDAFANAQLVDDFLTQGDTSKFLNALLLNIDNKQLTEERAIQVFDVIDHLHSSTFKNAPVVANKLHQLYPQSSLGIKYTSYLIRQQRYVQALKTLTSAPNNIKKTSIYFEMNALLLVADQKGCSQKLKNFNFSSHLIQIAIFLSQWRIVLSERSSKQLRV